MEILFVGGDSDGERATWDGLKPPKELRRSVRKPAPALGELEALHEQDALKAIGNGVVQSYALTVMRDLDGKDYHFYVGGNPAQPVRMIFEGYRKEGL